MKPPEFCVEATSKAHPNNWRPLWGRYKTELVAKAEAARLSADHGNHTLYRVAPAPVVAA